MNNDVSIDGRLSSPLLWVVVVPSTVVLALLTIVSPLWPLLGLAGIALLSFAFIRTTKAILFSTFFYYLLFRLVIVFQGPVRNRPEVIYLGTSLAVFIPYTAWLIKHMLGMDERDCKSGYQHLIGFLFLWGAVSLLWTADIVHGTILLSFLAVDFMIVQLLTVYVQSKADLRRLLVFLNGCGFALACLVLPSREFYLSWEREILSGVNLVYEIGGDILGPNPDRLRASGFAQVDLAGVALTTFLFISLAMVFACKSRGKRVILIGLFQLLLTCLILTGAKATAGAFIVGLYITLLLAPSLKGRRITALAIGTGAVILALLTTTVLLGENRVVKSVQVSEAGSSGVKSFSDRIEVWKEGFKDFRSFIYLLSGEGLGTSATKPEILPHVHSQYVSALVDLGLVGFLLFMTISAKGMIDLFLNIRRRHDIFLRDTMACLLGALVSALIAGLVYQEVTFPFFWMVIALVAPVATRCKDFEDRLKDETDLLA